MSGCERTKGDSSWGIEPREKARVSEVLQVADLEAAVLNFTPSKS